MKKLLPLILILGLFLPVQPASGVFGLSKCEKMKKAIGAEEKIGLESWKYFDDMRDVHGRDENYTFRIFQAILEVYKSDKTVATIASKNPKCFSSSENAKIRRLKTDRTNMVSSFEKYNLKWTGVSTFPWGGVYPKYLSIFDEIKQTTK